MWTNAAAHYARRNVTPRSGVLACGKFLPGRGDKKPSLARRALGAPVSHQRRSEDAVMFVTRIDLVTRRAAVRLVPEVVCPLCGNSRGVEMSVYKRYMILFGVLPLAPVNRFGAAYCHHCEQPIPRKADREGLAWAFEEVSADVPRSRPLTYAGTMLFAAITLVGFSALAVAMVQKTAREAAALQMQARIADPRPGDIELVHVYLRNASCYTLFKVVSISGDTVTLRAHGETKDLAAEERTPRSFSLKDSDFSSASFVAPKSRFANHFLFGTPLGDAEIINVLPSPQS
jgi:hypothetical protein